MTPGRLQALGYDLGGLAAVHLAVVAVYRPRVGIRLLVVVVLLVKVGAVAIFLAQARTEQA